MNLFIILFVCHLFKIYLVFIYLFIYLFLRRLSNGPIIRDLELP